ncbi:MAG: MFS transporter [Janthinobacterium lividum]
MPLWKRNLYACLFGSFTTAAGLSLVLPFLPLYIQELGVTDQASVVQWSGYAFGSTFLTAAFVSPLWGRLADTYGRKPMLLRAGLGMAVIMSLMGLVRTPLELVALRLVMGAVAGYVTAAITLVATRTPREHAGWALGTLYTGVVGGNLLGPLLGGWLAETIGLRHTFFVTGGLLFVTFLVTLLWIHEDFVRSEVKRISFGEVWHSIARPSAVVAMCVTALMLYFANFSIEPIVTVYIAELVGKSSHVALMSGIVVSASAIATMLAATRVGRLADRVGPGRVLICCLAVTGLTLLPQAWVSSWIQLAGWRFLMGLALAGLSPVMALVIKRAVPDAVAGRVFGYIQSSQYIGEIAGPVIGGHMAAEFGLRAVFYVTASLMFVNALWTWLAGVNDSGKPKPAARPATLSD